MSLSGTMNSQQGFTLSNSNSKINKSEINLFHKIQLLAADLSQVDRRLLELGQQCSGIRAEKESVDSYLEKKSEENRLRLMGELELFENEIRYRIETTKRQTQKVDERIEQMKEAQLLSLQMILSIQRRVQQLQIQLGADEQ